MEETVFPLQQLAGVDDVRAEALTGQNTTGLCTQQSTPQELQGENANPAEVLATWQSATDLCPASAITAEFQGAKAVGLPPQ